MSSFISIKVSNLAFPGEISNKCPLFSHLPASLFPPQLLLLLIANAWKDEVPNLLSHFLQILNRKEIKGLAWTSQGFSNSLEKKKISV